ncbi:MAG: polynucleotide adenylyltransferase PcnB [Chlamydiales bacterium]|nr:polynucleotide adenylyltransferase PcnB [Chlamydiales bacterium]
MQPDIYTAKNHPIRQEKIDKDAMYVMAKLQQAGFIAYLVGGSVRDLALGITPKDFDIVTSAKPEEIKRLFTNCLLIGRRFRLAHLRFGKKIIEVSTFRSGDTSDGELILRDNVWGTPEEDVLRRDFTINGLFYDPQEHSVIDYVGGCKDLSKHLLRTIGPPDIRFKQDPVRMLRLLKFRARFGFQVEKQTAHALYQCREELFKSAPARVLEEFFKMLESAAATSFLRILDDSDFLQILLPHFATFLQNENKERFFAYIHAADECIKTDKTSITDRAVLLTTLFFPLLEQKITSYLQTNDGMPPHFTEILTMTDLLIHEVTSTAFFQIPKRLRFLTQFILCTQYRLTPIDNKRITRYRITKHPDFPLSLQFLHLRTHVHPELKEPYSHWKKLVKHSHKHEKHA